MAVRFVTIVALWTGLAPVWKARMTIQEDRPRVEAHRVGSSLSDRFDARSNALAMIRLGLAAGVAVDHASFIGFGHHASIGSAPIGDLAVDGFFVISGFLVTRSYLRLNSVRRYAWHRFLRIAPGFWACLIISAVIIAPLMAVLDGHSAVSVFSGGQSSFAYVRADAFLQMRQFDINGNPFTAHAPHVVDGSLWTLFYEAICYTLIAGLGVAGVLQRRRWLVLAVCGGQWLLLALAGLGLGHVGSQYLLPLSFFFMLGAAGHLFADRLIINDVLAGACAAIVLAGVFLVTDYRPVIAPAFAYLCLWSIVRVPLRQNPSRDLSYGLYVYHWPIVQSLTLVGATAVTVLPFIALCVALALLAAVASWTIIEKPALSFKDAAWVDPELRARGRRVRG